MCTAGTFKGMNEGESAGMGEFYEIRCVTHGLAGGQFILSLKHLCWGFWGGEGRLGEKGVL